MLLSMPSLFAESYANQLLWSLSDVFWVLAVRTVLDG